MPYYIKRHQIVNFYISVQKNALLRNSAIYLQQYDLSPQTLARLCRTYHEVHGCEKNSISKIQDGGPPTRYGPDLLHHQISRFLRRHPPCVCVFACHQHEPCKNGRTDRDAVWVDSSGPMEQHFKRECTGRIRRTIYARRRSSLMPNYLAICLIKF